MEQYGRSWERATGGGSGIRTHDTVTRIAVFKTAAFVRSAIPPETILYPNQPRRLRLSTMPQPPKPLTFNIDTPATQPVFPAQAGISLPRPPNPFALREIEGPATQPVIPASAGITRPLPCGPLAAFKRLLWESPPKGVTRPSRVGPGAQDAVGGVPPGHRSPHSATIYPFRLVAQGPKLLSRRLRDGPLQVQLAR